MYNYAATIPGIYIIVCVCAHAGAVCAYVCECACKGVHARVYVCITQVRTYARTRVHANVRAHV